jgi:prepilin-type N-terminal cleavage/methylation domain-containing protein
LQVNSYSIDQKSGEIWTAQPDLQPIPFKPGRLLEAGFTLAELLVVMVIVGLSVGFVATAFDRTLVVAQEKQWVEKTLRELNRVKVKAILTGRAQQVALDFSVGSLRLTDGIVEQELLSLPEKYAYKSTMPDGEEMESLRIIFFPDGSATESRFDLIAPKTGRSRFRVRGLTGQVELLAAGKA